MSHNFQVGENGVKTTVKSIQPKKVRLLLYIGLQRKAGLNLSTMPGQMKANVLESFL